MGIIFENRIMRFDKEEIVLLLPRILNLHEINLLVQRSSEPILAVLLNILPTENLLQNYPISDEFLQMIYTPK